jgi:DNA modification methylase
MIQGLLSLNEASKWASNYLDRPVTQSNISYLIQYAKIKKYCIKQRKVKVNKKELKKYYDEFVGQKQIQWKNKLGQDLNWDLSFAHLRESDTTKHVHRLHPYKGKFIPQLVGYFLDSQINTFKKNIFFKKGDLILDPFMGSGTTLVQSMELGLHSIGIDISDFNCLISKVKLRNYDIFKLNSVTKSLFSQTNKFSNKVFDNIFDEQLREKLNNFNKKHFPNPAFKNNVINEKINEKKYGEEKIKQFLNENKEFFEKNGTKDKFGLLNEKDMNSFLNKWFSKRVKQELFYYIKLLNEVKDKDIKNILRIVLSRTARSCRATKHSDLATLKNPQVGPYYCRKHKKLCTPVNTIIKHLKRYSFDTLKRLEEFSDIKKNVNSEVIHGDSREVDIFKEIKKQNPEFFKLLLNKKISGVFTSPPYVGQINYHEQHAYSYELFNISREDNKEIGPLYKGQGKQAREEYVEGISNVLINIGKFIKDDGDYFIVANDKYNLYPLIAEKSGLRIIDKFKRPVLNRTEKDRQPYAEVVFWMRKKEKND